MGSRRYTLKKRADSRADTRARIIAAAAALQLEQGPAQVTVSAVADRAGVQRLTVYRHFPAEALLFAASNAHWLAQHPLPAPQRWQGIADADERLLTALTALYTYFRATGRMWAASYRDVGSVPALRTPLEQLRLYLDDVAARLAAAGTGGEAACITLRHAVQFATWATLDGLGLDDGEMADLVLGWLRGQGPVPAQGLR